MNRDRFARPNYELVRDSYTEIRNSYSPTRSCGLHFGFPFQTIIRGREGKGGDFMLCNGCSQSTRECSFNGFPYIIKDSIVPGPVTSLQFPHGLFVDNLRLLSYRTAEPHGLFVDNLRLLLTTCSAGAGFEPAVFRS